VPFFRKLARRLNPVAQAKSAIKAGMRLSPALQVIRKHKAKQSAVIRPELKTVAFRKLERGKDFTHGK